MIFVRERVFVVLAHLIAGCAAQIKDAIVIQHPDVAIVSRRDFQTNNPILDSIGINFHYDRFFRLFVRFFLARTCLRLFLFALLRFFFFSFLRSLADFIALRRERIRSVFRQRNEINALHVAIDIREFLIAKSWFEIARRSEQQIFSVIAEDRFARTVPTVGDGGLLFVRERVQVNARHVVLFGTRPGNPLTVGRPVITLDLAEFVLVDLGHGLGRNIDIAQPLQAIAPEQLSCCRATISARSNKCRRHS